MLLTTSAWATNLARGDWWPGACLLCAEAVQGPLDLCAGCVAELPTIAEPCPRCGLPMNGAPACACCTGEDWPLDRCVALAAHAPPVDRLINAFKRHAGLTEGRNLSLLLAERIRRSYAEDAMPGAIVAVPMHWRRRFKRGFNQADEIARTLSRKLGIPWATGACRRVRATEFQQHLDATGRRRNLRAAFHCRDVACQHVALVDDVVTTGITAASVAQGMRAIGVARVDLWCLARAERAEVTGARHPEQGARQSGPGDAEPSQRPRRAWRPWQPWQPWRPGRPDRSGQPGRSGLAERPRQPERPSRAARSKRQQRPARASE